MNARLFGRNERDIYFKSITGLMHNLKSLQENEQKMLKNARFSFKFGCNENTSQWFSFSFHFFIVKPVLKRVSQKMWTVKNIKFPITKVWSSWKQIFNPPKFFGYCYYSVICSGSFIYQKHFFKSLFIKMGNLYDHDVLKWCLQIVRDCMLMN